MQLIMQRLDKDICYHVITTILTINDSNNKNLQLITVNKILNLAVSFCHCVVSLKQAVCLGLHVYILYAIYKIIML